MNSIKEYGKEALEIGIKTALSTIPVGGTLITCIMDSVKSNTLQKRLDEWREMVEQRLSKLECSLYDIGNNELFTSCIIKATDTALKTSQSEKRNYLADAVFNSSQIDMDENIAMIYLDMLERYSFLHLKILHFFYNPKAFEGINISKYSMGSAIDPLYDTYPELKGHKEIINKIVKDLYSEGLLNTENLSVMMSGSGMIAKRTTELGDNFINFITYKN